VPKQCGNGSQDGEGDRHCEYISERFHLNLGNLLVYANDPQGAHELDLRAALSGGRGSRLCHGAATARSEVDLPFPLFFAGVGRMGFIYFIAAARKEPSVQDPTGAGAEARCRRLYTRRGEDLVRVVTLREAWPAGGEVAGVLEGLGVHGLSGRWRMESWGTVAGTDSRLALGLS